MVCFLGRDISQFLTGTQTPHFSRCCGLCKMGWGGDESHGKLGGRRRGMSDSMPRREGRTEETKDGIRPHAAFHSSTAIYKYAAASRKRFR